MLALLPELLWLAPFSALVLRLSLALILATHAWRHVSGAGALARGASVIELLTAVALVLGAGTQAAGLVSAALCVAYLAVPRLRGYPRSTVLLALAISLSLVVTGPGAFAFDLPL